MRNVSDKSYRENQNRHFVFSNIFFLQNRSVYLIMSTKYTEQATSQFRFACRIPKATNTYSEYIIITKMVARTRLNVTLYVRCMFCYISLPGNNIIIIIIYLLTAIGLTPGGSSTVHIYTQTVYRTTQYVC
jgi:hypothetical protein